MSFISMPENNWYWPCRLKKIAQHAIPYNCMHTTTILPYTKTGKVLGLEQKNIISLYDFDSVDDIFQWLNHIFVIDPFGRPTVTAGSDHCFHTYCPSTVGLAQWIIDDTCLVLFIYWIHQDLTQPSIQIKKAVRDLSIYFENNAGFPHQDRY